MFKDANVPGITTARCSQQTATINSVVIRIAMIAFSVLTLCQSGCKLSELKGPQAAMISYRDFVWSQRAYNLRFGNCDRPYAEHFEAGFCEGYEDIARGGDGYVPAMPPKEYRSYEYQCAEGAQCVNAWFEGYPAGVAAARKDKIGNYNNIMISRMINSAISQESAEKVLPSDVPILNSESSAGPPTPSTNTNTTPVNYSTPAFPRNIVPSINGPMTAPLFTPAESNTEQQPQASRQPIPVVTNSNPNGEPLAQPNAGVATMPPIVVGSGVDTQSRATTTGNNQPLMSTASRFDPRFNAANNPIVLWQPR